MNLLLNPIPIYIAIAMGLLASVALFWTLKLELTKHTRRQQLRERLLEGSIRILETNLESVQKEIQSSGQRAPAADLQFQPGSLNFTKRSQALRLLRRGQPVEHVAEALQLARQEVELLVKVHQLSEKS